MAERKNKKNATPVTEENLTTAAEETTVAEEAIAETAQAVNNTEASPADAVAPETVVEPVLVTESLGDTKSLGEGVMQERNVQNVSTRQKVGKVFVKIALYAFLCIMALIVVFPFYWMIISSLKNIDEYYLINPTYFPMQGIDFANYAEAFKMADMGVLFFNTVYVGVVSTILSLIITVLSAFAFARLEFRGKNILFGALLATMMIPGELFTITNYQTVVAFGWKDTYTVLIVPFLVSVFYIYLLRQNFKQIPDELYYAAKVDGTSDLKYLWKIMVPLAMPTLISITILKMMGSWNSYIWPRLVANEEMHRLITYGIRHSFEVMDGQLMDYPVQMAAVTIVSIPLFLVFVFLRKYIMKGVSHSGLKG